MNSTKKQMAALALLAVVSFAYAQTCYVIGGGVPCIQEGSTCYGEEITLPEGGTMRPMGTVENVQGSVYSCIPYPFGNTGCNTTGTTSCTFYCRVKATQIGEDDEVKPYTFNVPTAQLSSDLCNLD